MSISCAEQARQMGWVQPLPQMGDVVFHGIPDYQLMAPAAPMASAAIVTPSSPSSSPEKPKKPRKKRATKKIDTDSAVLHKKKSKKSKKSARRKKRVVSDSDSSSDEEDAAEMLRKRFIKRGRCSVCGQKVKKERKSREKEEKFVVESQRSFKDDEQQWDAANTKITEIRHGSVDNQKNVVYMAHGPRLDQDGKVRHLIISEKRLDDLPVQFDISPQ